jgi:hypothetical protein
VEILDDTTVEETLFNTRALMVISIFRECPEEYREELFAELVNHFCSDCWRSLDVGEVCHCSNDE